jgi:hypothetical protein
MIRSRLALVVIAILAVGFFSAPGHTEVNEWGQVTLGGRPDDNVAAAGARSPGTMVNIGVVRSQLGSQFAQSPIEITDPTPTDPEPRHVFLSEAIEILFEQLNETLLYFENLLRERAGLDPREPEDGSITGVVTSGDDDSPVRGATVTAFDEDDEEVATATTDRDGEYTLTGLPAGDYLLEITAEDFADEVVDVVTVRAGGTTQDIDVELSPARISE